MVVKSNGKKVYGSWKDGSDIYKEKKVKIKTKEEIRMRVKEQIRKVKMKMKKYIK